MLEVVVLVLIFFLLGYMFGKRIGQQNGFEVGRTSTALILRQQSYEQGYCVICREVILNNEIERTRIESTPPDP
jgi:hypothetical protein